MDGSNQSFIAQFKSIAVAIYAFLSDPDARALSPFKHPNGAGISIREAKLKGLYQKQDIDNSKDKELERLREFYRKIYSYIGTYPNWKVQQEYRQLMTTLIPDDDLPPHLRAPYHLHNIDAYLTKVVDETNKVSDLFPELSHPITRAGRLSEARGDYYLEEIALKHPSAKHYF